MNKWIENIINSKSRIAIPIMTHPGIEDIGKHVIDAVKDGNVHFQAIQNIANKYNSYACTTIMDLTLEAEAFGSQVNFTENEVPSVTNRIVYDEETVNALSVPDLTKGRVPEYLKAARLAVENIKEKPILGGCIGPFSLAGRLYGMSEIMVAIYIEPDVIHNLLKKCTSFILQYCKELKEIGLNGVIMAEPAAGLLSNEDCEQFSSDYIKLIVDTLQDDDFSIILHNCGNKGQCTQAMLKSGAAGLHFGNAINIADALAQCPDDKLIMGNLDPVGLFKLSDSETMYNATMDLLKKTTSYNNFVISSGCDLPPHTPHANITAFFKAVNEYNSSLS